MPVNPVWLSQHARFGTPVAADIALPLRLTKPAREVVTTEYLKQKTVCLADVLSNTASPEVDVMITDIYTAIRKYAKYANQTWSMLTAMPAFLGRIHAARIRGLEKEIGYKLMFPQIDQRWIQGWASVNLTRNWRKAGLSVTGIDYFTAGSLVGGLSTRFDPSADQFQSWIGGYLVRSDDATPHTFQDDLNLAVVDQLHWLGHYGDPFPACRLSASSFTHCGQTVVSGYTGQLYVGGGTSHSDIGDRNNRVWLKCATRVVAMAFNANNPALRLASKNFMPMSSGTSYDDVFLKGYIISIEIEQHTHAILYGNGAIYRNEQGEVDTFETIKHSLLDTLRQVVIART